MKAKTNKLESLPCKKYLCTFESPLSVVVKEDNENDKPSTLSTYSDRHTTTGLSKIYEDESNQFCNLKEGLGKCIDLRETPNFAKSIEASN